MLMINNHDDDHDKINGNLHNDRSKDEADYGTEWLWLLQSWMNVMQQCIRLLHMYGPPYILYQTAHSTGCNVVHLTLRRLVGVVTQCQCTQHSRKKGEGL